MVKKTSHDHNGEACFSWKVLDLVEGKFLQCVFSLHTNFNINHADVAD